MWLAVFLFAVYPAMRGRKSTASRTLYCRACRRYARGWRAWRPHASRTTTTPTGCCGGLRARLPRQSTPSCERGEIDHPLGWVLPANGGVRDAYDCLRTYRMYDTMTPWVCVCAVEVLECCVMLDVAVRCMQNCLARNESIAFTS